MEVAHVVPNNILIYRADDNRLRLEVKLEEKTIWLSQKQVGELYQKSKATISEHIKNIFQDGELDPKATVRKFRTVQDVIKNGTGDWSLVFTFFLVPAFPRCEQARFISPILKKYLISFRDSWQSQNRWMHKSLRLCCIYIYSFPVDSNSNFGFFKKEIVLGRAQRPHVCPYILSNHDNPRISSWFCRGDSPGWPHNISQN